MTYAIAHRGLSVAHVENTLAAFEGALALGHVIEVDVRCTHDAVPVCTHDASLARTWGASVKVGLLEHAALAEVAPALPTLAEVLDLALSHDGAVMLDVKVSRPRAIEAIEAVVAASGMRWNDGRQLRRGEQLDPGTATFQSADAQLLQAFRSRTGAGCVELVKGASSARELILTAPFIMAYAQGVTIPDALATRGMLRTLRGLRLGTYVYTVNDQDRFEELAANGASGVYTDTVDVVG
ncbi:MAG: glycerophosphodiester phosphodiesterase [Thermoleophilia bacterium]|nr:glycerophosphodiester phosphodiesterase [Thermoleophilia bacterium]